MCGKLQNIGSGSSVVNMTDGGLFACVFVCIWHILITTP